MALYWVELFIPGTVNTESVFIGLKLLQFIPSEDDCQLRIDPVLSFSWIRSPMGCPSQILVMEGPKVPPLLFWSTVTMAAVLESALHTDPFPTRALNVVVAFRFCAI